MQKKPLLSISLLVSNRIDTIRNCMESLRPLLERVPGELIVVDTVGEENSDGSLEVAKEYATKVVHFDWCNDFGAARNAGLSQASGEWFLFLDDDEWFETVTPIIEFFNTGSYKNYDSAGYYVRNYTNFEGTDYADAYVQRMVRLTSQHRFVGKIHEKMEPAGKVSKCLNCFVHHYGYVYKSKQDEQDHFERNVSLLKEELKDNPTDIHLIAQLVQEYKVAGMLEEEKKLCEITLENYKGNWENQLVQYLIINLASVERRSGNDAEAENSLVKIEQQYPLTDISKAVCAIEHIIYEQIKQNHEKVLWYIKEFLKSREKACLQGEHYFIAEFLDAASLDKQQEIVLAGLRTMTLCKEYQDAELFFLQVDWKNQKSIPYEQLQLLFSVYEATQNGRMIFICLNRALENQKLHIAAQTLLNNYLARYPEKKQQISLHLAGKF